MNPPVSLRTLVEKLQNASDERRTFMSRSTGEFAVIDADELDRHRNASAEKQSGDAPVNEILHSKNWIALPDPYEIDDYELMRRFCYSIADPEVRAGLLRQSEGPGAFARFGDALTRLDLMEDWLVFKRRKYTRFAIDWLEGNGIPYQDDFREGK